MTECVVCHSKSVRTDPDTTETFCGDCGVVVSGPVLATERRYNNVQPISGPVQRSGSFVDPSAWRISQTQRREFSRTGRSLRKNIEEIDRVCSVMGVPGDTKEEAKALLSKSPPLRGIPHVVRAAALVMTASRNARTPLDSDGRVLTVKMVARSLEIPAKSVWREMKRLNLRQDETTRPLLVSRYIKAGCDRLFLPRKVFKRALELSEEWSTQRDEGCTISPMAEAAVVVWMATEEKEMRAHRTKQDLAAAFNVTPVTIRNGIHKFKMGGVLTANGMWRT